MTTTEQAASAAMDEAKTARDAARVMAKQALYRLQRDVNDAVAFAEHARVESHWRALMNNLRFTLEDAADPRGVGALSAVRKAYDTQVEATKAQRAFQRAGTQDKE